MATISATQQANISFLGYHANRQSGQKTTISTISASISKSITQDIFQASQRPLAARFTIAYSNGSGQPIQLGQPLPISTNKLWEFQSQRIYGGEEDAEASDSSADFTVDSTVNGSAPGDADDQTATNLRQAAQIGNQMGIGRNDGSLESLARDLAVFGLDFTALDDTPEALIEKIRERSLSMLDELAASNGSVQERNRITGASARLVNGIQSSSGAFFSVDSSTTVTVDGTEINGDAAYKIGSVVVDPLILDLGGDGIDLSSAEEGVEFDMDGDGVKTQTGFIRGDDALLFVDEYGDGMVHDGRQLFGNTDGHANGFEKLAAHDDNGDGVIDRNDAIWDSLKVWVEKTADGVTTEGETMSLEEAGVESINVGYENVREDDGKGNLIGQTGTFTRADGTTGLAADAWLQEIRTRGPF